MFWGLTCFSPIGTGIVPVIHWWTLSSGLCWSATLWSVLCLLYLYSSVFSLNLGQRMSSISQVEQPQIWEVLFSCHTNAEKLACSMLSLRDALTIICVTTAYSLLLCELFVTMTDGDARIGG
jgi:hypothetical protein